MARALGMNPRKLPGLRPSSQERWKLPVGEFIEERYRKRFGGDPRDHDPRDRSRARGSVQAPNGTRMRRNASGIRRGN
jgi:hypothetical protein